MQDRVKNSFSQVKKSLGKFKKIPLVKYVAASILINIIGVSIVILTKNSLPPQVPLFYGLAQSEEQLVPTFNLVIPSVTSLLIVFSNSLVSLLLENDFLKKTLVLSGLATAALSVITTLKIISLLS